MVTCCRDIGKNKNPTIFQLINKDLLETLGNYEATTESFYNNVTKNDDVINNNDITLSVPDNHSFINYNISHNNIDEDSLKSTKDKETSYNEIMSNLSKLYNTLKQNKKQQTIVFVFYHKKINLSMLFLI